MIAVCQNVALSAEDKLVIRHRLRKHKILMKIFPNQVGTSPRVQAPRSPAPPTQSAGPLPRSGPFDPSPIAPPCRAPGASSPPARCLHCGWGPRKLSAGTPGLTWPVIRPPLPSTCPQEAVFPAVPGSEALPRGFQVPKPAAPLCGAQLAAGQRGAQGQGDGANLEGCAFPATAR